MEKILVTGGAGFIGSHLTRRLLSLKRKLICVDNFDDYYDPKIKERNIEDFIGDKNFKLYREDVCNFSNLGKIFGREKPDKICHLAARGGVRPSLENPDIYIKTNIAGTVNLLNLAVKNNVKDFLFASSSSVYGNNKKIPFSEEDCVDQPISPYAVTKRAAELLVYNYHHLYKLNCKILRFFSVYGPSGRPDMVPFLFTEAIFKGNTIKKFGNGKSKRDYTFIDDVIDGIISALDSDFSYQIINLGSNKPIDLNYLILLIEKLLGKKAIVQKIPEQPGDLNLICADISKAKKLLGYNPKISVEEGMKRFVEWYLKNNACY